MEPVKVGVIGCGNISDVYFDRSKNSFQALEVVACADLAMDRAEAKTVQWGIPRACTVEELLADPEIEIVLNLTVPKAHHEVSLAALKAGKSVYGEKPLSLTREEGLELLDTAKTAKRLLGSAPDTFLGAGLQTCRKLIDDGWIGKPVAANAFMMSHGVETWHPNPEFYYKTGGGPMFDMGPYYLTALIHLIGPVKSVTGMTAKAFPERVATCEACYGLNIKVEVPTHVAGLMEFSCGAVGTIITSFDVWGADLPRIEVHGTEGSLSVPDPNTFGGPIKIRNSHSEDWQEIPLAFCYSDNFRGIGPADMAYALRTGRQHRACGEMAYHVLDIMHAFHDSADAGRRIDLESTCAQPAPLPLGLREGLLDE